MGYLVFRPVGDNSRRCLALPNLLSDLYFLWFPKDRTFIKFLGMYTRSFYILFVLRDYPVITLFALDSLQTAVCAYDVWITLVSGWGNLEILTITPWSLCIAVILGGLGVYTSDSFTGHNVSVSSSFCHCAVILCSSCVDVEQLYCNHTLNRRST